MNIGLRKFILINNFKLYKLLFEFVLACLLVCVAGCSAIAGFFKPEMITAFIFGGAIIGLIAFFVTKAKH